LVRWRGNAPSYLKKSGKIGFIFLGPLKKKKFLLLFFFGCFVPFFFMCNRAPSLMFPQVLGITQPKITGGILGVLGNSPYD
jgi:hypothetical protein